MNRLLVCSTLIALAGVLTRAQSPRVVALRTQDVVLRFEAGPASPHLLTFAGANKVQWRNAGVEEFPSSVEVDAHAMPVHWSHVAGQDHVDAHHISFVYESAEPHLRLEWQWQARAPFGAIEHTITITNFSKREVWLPMIDSLTLHIPQDAARRLNNFYVEKGADTPSPQGVHVETITDGYHWTGHSTTYAFPRKGEAREIIPAEIVYGSADPQAAGMPASSSVAAAALPSRETALISTPSLASIPNPYNFSTGLGAGESFQRQPPFSAHSPAVQTAPAISCAPGSDLFSAIPRPGMTHTIHWWLITAGVAEWPLTRPSPCA